MPTDPSPQRSPDTRWVFGLLIDEEISWGFIQVTQEGYVGDLLLGTFGRTDDAGRSGPRGRTQDGWHIERYLRSRLQNMRRRTEYRALFREVDAVGVSAIGLVDHRSLLLTRIARKNWMPKRGPIIDFRSLFHGIFDRLSTTAASVPGIFIQNDATAKCLAESYHLGADRPDSLFYVLVSEGVNCGFVRNGRPVVTELHPELGHVYPRLHRHDHGFNIANSGCPVHRYCFEGLTSNARIRRSWDKAGKLSPLPLAALRNVPGSPWNMIAYYVAQLCIIGALAVSPNRIVIGGSVAFPKLMPLIRKAFECFNRGDFETLDSEQFATLEVNRWKQRYLDYPAMTDLDNFIQYRKLGDNAGLLGALELARIGAFSSSHPRPS